MPNNENETENKAENKTGLDSLLTEINTEIKKEKTNNPSNNNNNANRIKSNKSSKSKKASNGNANQAKKPSQEKLEKQEKPSDIFELEDQQKFSFVENARIIEDEPEKPEFRRNGLHKDEKFIEVSEITETEEEEPDTTVLVELSAPLKKAEAEKGETVEKTEVMQDEPKGKDAKEETVNEKKATLPPQEEPAANSVKAEAKPPEHNKKAQSEAASRRQRAEARSNSETSASAVSRNKQQTKKSSKPQKGMVILGVFIAFFVIIGLISTVWTGVKVTSNIFNETELKAELARELFPLVIVDIPAFDDPSKLDSSAIISSSIWEFIINEENKSKYKKDDLGSMYVPDVDIEKYVRALYGTEVKIVHQSVDDSTVQMIYNSESKYYVIESTPKFLPYTPRVDKIIKTGDIYTLRVSYVLPDAMWNMSVKNKEQTVDKIMEYKVKRVDNSYQMLSVTLIEVTNNSQNMEIDNVDSAGAMSMEELEPVESELPSSVPEAAPANAAVSGESAPSNTSSGNASSEVSSKAAN